MVPLILLIDDEVKFLEFVKNVLENNNYNVMTAQNGYEALEVLATSEILPDLIICDIKMPKMDGFDFFKSLSKNPEWNQIPFVFLSGLSSPEDIRFGKMLGADDYLIKPIIEEDLISVVECKIARYYNIKTLDEKINQSFLNLEEKIISKETNLDNIIFLYMNWDDIKGPILKSYHYEQDPQFSINQIGNQLFLGFKQIFSKNSYDTSVDLLLNIQNLKNNSFLLFDYYEYNGKKNLFMLSIITKSISYFQSLKLREIMSAIANKIKMKETWDIKNYWDRLSDILLE